MYRVGYCNSGIRKCGACSRKYHIIGTLVRDRHNRRQEDAISKLCSDRIARQIGLRLGPDMHIVPWNGRMITVLFLKPILIEVFSMLII